VGREGYPPSPQKNLRRNYMATTTSETKEKMVKIRIPRDRKDEADVYVSVNEREWLIKRGVEVEVPECVAEVLRNQEIALEKADAFNDEVENKVSR
jgi:hypothetical protein